MCAVLVCNGQVLMFKDINPQAPTHLLVIPKQRQGLTQLRKAQPDHASLLGHMLTCIAKVWARLHLPAFAFDTPVSGKERARHVESLRKALHAQWRLLCWMISRVSETRQQVRPPPRLRSMQTKTEVALTDTGGNRWPRSKSWAITALWSTMARTRGKRYFTFTCTFSLDVP